MSSHNIASKSLKRPKPVLRSFKRFARSKDGATAIEFAMLALPFFMLIFAILETFIAFAGEQVLTNAVDDMARGIRTGQITLATVNKAKFREKMCDEIKPLLSCSGSTDSNTQKLYIDVRELKTYAEIKNSSAPLKKSGSYLNLNPANFKYSPGGPGTINLVRAFYRWKITADFMRPYLGNVSPDGSKPSEYLMMASTAVLNEKYTQ